MARRNTPDSAYRAYFEPLARALGCITFERLFVIQNARFESGPVYTLTLNDNEPVPLRGKASLALSVGQRFRIIQDKSLDDGPYRVQLVSYWYAISTSEDREILAFHWTPEADPTVMRTIPHLHVGSVNISGTAPLLPKTFNKLHIPTGYVPIQDIVRFLIEELGVQPRRQDWSGILRLSMTGPPTR